MTEQEELELAAKAAGIKALRCPNGVLRDCTGLDPAMNIFSAPEWNPFTSDGDALRLAVKLRIGVLHRSSGIEAHTFRSRLIICNEECAEGFDYYAATRRAIVRAAAEIGRNMT